MNKYGITHAIVISVMQMNPTYRFILSAIKQIYTPIDN